MKMFASSMSSIQMKKVMLCAPSPNPASPRPLKRNVMGSWGRRWRS
jgi:hypothetical protein